MCVRVSARLPALALRGQQKLSINSCIGWSERSSCIEAPASLCVCVWVILCACVFVRVGACVDFARVCVFQVPEIQMPVFQFPSPEDIERNGGTVVGLLRAC